MVKLFLIRRFDKWSLRQWAKRSINKTTNQQFCEMHEFIGNVIQKYWNITPSLLERRTLLTTISYANFGAFGFHRANTRALRFFSFSSRRLIIHSDIDTLCAYHNMAKKMHQLWNQNFRLMKNQRDGKTANK